MEAKYKIVKINNGWILTDKRGDEYFEELKELLDTIQKRDYYSDNPNPDNVP